MSSEAKWAVVMSPVEDGHSGAWGPFERKEDAERWLDGRIASGQPESDALYGRGYVVRLDNPV